MPLVGAASCWRLRSPYSRRSSAWWRGSAPITSGLNLRIAALEQRVAQAEWRDGVNRGGAAKVSFRNWFPEGAFACTMISLWEGARA